MAIPIAGREAVDQRWEGVKPLILLAAAELLDSPRGDPWITSLKL
jgi:hypothetical protein